MHGKVLRGNRPSPRQSARAKSLVILAFTGLVLALSAPVAFADCPLTDPTCIVDQTKQTATDTANSVKDKADAAVKQATDTASSTRSGCQRQPRRRPEGVVAVPEEAAVPFRTAGRLRPPHLRESAH